MSRWLSRINLASLSRPQITSYLVRRSFRIHVPTGQPQVPFTRRITRIGLVSGAMLGTSIFVGGHVYAEEPPDQDSEDGQFRRKPTPLNSLLRSYAVYSICSIPMLVDWSPTILNALFAIPGINVITEAIVRVTFYAQFVGGNTAYEAVPLLGLLRAENKGALFGYSVEADEKETSGKSQQQSKITQPVHKRIVQEMIRSIDVAADFEDKLPSSSAVGRRTWVAVKITALVPDAHALINLSTHLVKTRPASPVAFPGTPLSSDLDVLRQSSLPTGSSITEEDVVILRELHSDLIRICTRAQERGVKIVIDAEYSWYQPALDAIIHALMQQFNKPPTHATISSVQPLVYNTYQAYLRRTPEHLVQSLRSAKAGNYSLGVKLVRGAYHPHETHAHDDRASGSPSLSISPDLHPPVWSTKADTDKCYNLCAELLIDRIKDDIASKERNYKGPRPPALSVLFGTHNWDSCDLILDTLVSRGLAEKETRKGDPEEVVKIGDSVTERVTFGQLYGMSDALTNYLVNKTRTSTPFVIKYVPYGALVEVMPYLSRRAIENKSVLGDGGAAEERRRAGAEIRRRLFG